MVTWTIKVKNCAEADNDSFRFQFQQINICAVTLKYAEQDHPNSW